MKLTKPNLKTIIAAMAAAAVMTAFVGLGALQRPDYTASDLMYQEAAATDGQIVVVGMDQRALEELGPMPWPRNYIAEAISYLNSDPDAKPAVIGVDVLYVANSADPEADAALVAAAAEGGNVVFASAATFGSELVESEDDGSFYMDTRAVQAWDQPFDELYAVSDIGHINAMSDTDGYIRHALYSVDIGDRVIKSFSSVIYEKYRAAGHDGPDIKEPKDGGFFYIPFHAKPGAYYEEISVLDLLWEEVDSSYFADKIVLIGPYAAGMQDEYRTSADHSVPMYGIEIQANLIEAFRTGFYPKEAGDSLQLLICFLVFLFAFFFLKGRKVLPSVIFWAVLTGGWLAICYLAYWHGAVILHPLWLTVPLTVEFIGSIAINYIKAAKEKRFVTKTFGRYVDPAVLKTLLEQDAAKDLGGKMFDIAVLFVDIRGFTTMSESLEPTQVVNIINKYLTLTTECIMKNHGTLDKFVGDCTMAFWNAPLPQEDPVYLACRAAMDMVEGSKALGEELMREFGRSVDFGVGVHFGPAVVGNIGAPMRMDYTAIGDTVNTSSRLESNAPAGTVYISRVVADMLGDRAKTTSLGATIKLKGKAEGFEVLTLDSLE